MAELVRIRGGTKVHAVARRGAWQDWIVFTYCGKSGIAHPAFDATEATCAVCRREAKVTDALAELRNPT